MARRGMPLRALALTAAKQEAAATARAVTTAARASETAASASKAAASASEDEVRSASLARGAISRAREALRAARVDSNTKTHRFAEAGVSAGDLPLVMTATAPAPVPAPGQSTPRQHLTSEVAVYAWTRRPGDGDFL